jgi:hypothetical protein
MRLAIQLMPLVLLLGGSAPALAAVPKAAPDLQQRVRAKLTAEPALAASLGSVPAEMKALDWLVGTWEVRLSAVKDPQQVGTSEITRLWDGKWLQLRNALPGGIQDIGYIGYNPAMRQWQSVTIDNLGNANISRATAWERDRIVFEGDVVVIGLPAHLRQTVTRIGDREFHVASDELLAGTWRHIEDYHFTKTSQ